MRIVAGTARGRRIEAPAGRGTRPTTDRVREALFNALGSMGVVDGATVVDLFAGSGALGLEALSRGAAHATFVDTDRRAHQVIKHNLDSLGFGDRARVVVGDGLGFLATAPRVDLVMCDPPYDFAGWDELLARVEASVVVCESDREIEPPRGWRVARQKRYGTSVVTILIPESPE